MALRLIGVSRRYGDQQVLDQVSLHVRPGDCYGFLGHNGAGKSTAMRIALGLIRADAGRVLVDGFDAAEHPLEARARMGGLIEVPGFHAALSGRKNLVLLARLQGLGRREAVAEADRVLDAVGLAYAAEKPAGAYSQGMRQRLGIAQALLGRPKVVLLDEPTNGLDPEGIEEIRRLLRRLTKDEGATVLLSSHQLHELAGVCNRVGILRKGKLLVEDETVRLLRRHADRHVLRTSDDERAATALAALGLAPRLLDMVHGGATGPGLEVDLGARPPGEVARAIVEAGIELRAFAPREATLEEIYLQFTRDGAAAAAASPDAPPVAGVPTPRIAPPGPVRRTAAYDVRRWASSVAVPLALAAPLAIGVLGIVKQRLDASAMAEKVARGEAFSTTQITAFFATAFGLRLEMPFLVFTVATLAALSIAGEFGRGTLRNVVLRPVGRARATLGKTLATLGAAAVAYVLLAAVTMGVAAFAFDFADLAETLPNGQLMVAEGFAAKDLWPELARTLAWQAPELAAFAGIGVLVGSVARSGAGAVVGVLATTVALVVLPASLATGAAAWLPGGHVAWADPEATPVGRLLELSNGASNATRFDARAAWVPLAWAGAAVGVACWRMRRRAIP